MPWRARICDWRYKGQWSAYFATSTWATSRSVGRPPAISLAGAAACTTPSWQLRQAYFGRRVTSPRYCAGMTSSRDERSSPITCIAPPQHRQAVVSGSMTISTRGRCSGSEPRPGPRVSARGRLAGRSRLGAGTLDGRIGLLLLGLGFGDGLLDILQRKIELIGVELFRAPAELQALQLADQVAQPVILTGELRLFGALDVAFSTGLSE